MFDNLFRCKPQIIEDGIPCFGNELDGDFYSEADISTWRNGGFQNSLLSSKLIDSNETKHLLNELSKETYVIDLASGPGMGLIPSLLRINPNISCMATDANVSVLKEWKSFLADKPSYKRIHFTQFSLMDIPFKDNSVPVYSSFIGLSSTKEGLAGYNHVTKEVFRSLNPGGKLFTVEVDWTDIPSIINLFSKMDKHPWSIFTEAIETGIQTWHERFIDNGFKILYHDLFEFRHLKGTDNELGEAAERFGVEIGMNFNAFIIQKP